MLAVGWSTTLLSGRLVLGLGNADTGQSYHSAAFLYDLDTNEWTATGDIPEGVVGLSSSVTVIPGGKVLALGMDAKREPTALLFDPGSRQWTATGAVPEGSPTPYGLRSILLPNGSVLVLRAAGPSAGWLYDPGANRWSTTATFPVETHGFPYAVALANGLVLVIAQGSDRSKSWAGMLYDPINNTWKTTGALPAKFQGSTAAATVLADGSVLVMGYQYDPDVETCALIYRPRTNEWIKFGRPPNDIVGVAAMRRMPNGRIFVIAHTTRQFGETTLLFDPVTPAWKPIGDPVDPVTGIGVLGSLVDGSAWGIGYRSNVRADALRYSASRNSWELIGQLPPGVEHVSQALENGAVLVFTGPHTGGRSHLAQAFLFFP